MAKSKAKIPCIAILISYKINFKTKNIMKGKKAFYNVKVSVHQEQIIILNMYRPSNRASKDMKQKNLQNSRETIIAAYFNFLFALVDRINIF